MGSLKNLTFRGGFTKKNNIEGGLPKKMGAWTACQFKGGWQERGGGVFEGAGVDAPTHTMSLHVFTKLKTCSLVKHLVVSR